MNNIEVFYVILDEAFNYNGIVVDLCDCGRLYRVSGDFADAITSAIIVADANTISDSYRNSDADTNTGTVIIADGSTNSDTYRKLDAGYKSICIRPQLS